MRETQIELTSAQRTALVAVLEGQVRMGVEENLIHPVHVDRPTLAALGAELGLWRWNIRLPGGCAELTPRGREALA